MKLPIIYKLVFVVGFSFSICRVKAQTVDVYLNDETHMVIEDSLKLVFNNAMFFNNGSFVPGKSVTIFSGTQPSANILSKSITPFYTLAINKSNGNVELYGNISVTNSLQMINGNIELNGYTLDLGNTGSIHNEHEGSLITGVNGGVVQIVADLIQPNKINPGNIGIEITSASSFGKTIIIRGHQSQVANGKSGIQRYFELRPSYNTDKLMQIKFNYIGSELGGNNENSLSLLSRESTRESWKDLGKDYVNLVSHWVLKDKVTASGRFTLLPSEFPDIVQSKLNITAYPNPTPGQFVLSIKSDHEADLVIRLIDIQGTVQQSQRIHVQKGITNNSWDISQYSAGTYSLVFSPGYQQQVKISKQ